ncbi:MAG: ankyrin repeat domain-containing protein [Aureispira sp.]
MIKEETIEEFSNAVVYGVLEKVKEMINENPAIVNAQDKYGFTALHNVMCEEQRETVLYLLEKGAVVNIKNEDGITPLHLACTQENAALLIQAGAEVNIRSNQGNTPLHILVSDGAERLDVIQYLLSNGANKQLKNEAGQLAIDVAKGRAETRIIKLLQ